jgi:hypothetical protein
MTHDLLEQLAAQRQTRLANRAEWERRMSPTRPTSAATRRTAARRAAGPDAGSSTCRS